MAYLAEAAARVVIIEQTSAGTALANSKVMPYVVAGALVAWMTVYGRAARRKGERAAALAGAAAAANAVSTSARPASPEPGPHVPNAAGSQSA